MRNTLLILCPLVFSLLGCSLSNNSSSTSSEEEISEKEKCQKEIDSFIASLKSYEHVVNSYQYEAVLLHNYNALNIASGEKGTATIYNSSEVGKLLVQQGTYSMLDPDDNFKEIGDKSTRTIQKYVTNDRYWQLTKWEPTSESTPNTKKAEYYSEEKEEAFFSLSLSIFEESVLTGFLDNIGESNIRASYSFPTIDGDGEYQWNYELNVLQEGTITETIKYENTLKIEGGLITYSNQFMVDNLLSNGQVINFVASEVDKYYSYSEITSYTGEIFNPKDFKSA